ncbi:hypothetical protein [Actinomadura sp. 7K507]|uniref:hypothetical protein n=1 Tax=Actinomadura sp. 7K507 TaxID=2530365 RepID=UPI001A9EFEFB|nr:hypothetical protein [Actinomadura sp. 7K507]
MTTTSRRPPAPAKTPKNATRERPADAAAPATSARSTTTGSTTTRGTTTRGTTTRGTTTRGTTTGSRPAKAAPARRPAPAKSTATRTAGKTATKPTGKTAAKPKTTKPTKAAKATKATQTAKTAGSGAKAAAARSRPAAARRTQAPPRTPFVLLIVGLLGGALVSLLLLNTVLAQDAFTLTRLQQSNKQLEQQRQAYEEQNARESSPEELSNKAKALGMKKAEDPAFFATGSGRASDGGIRPVPHAAAASAGAAGVVGVPGTVVPGDGVPPGTGGGTGQGARTGNGAP